MKRTLKVLIPLVLILAILVTACWYFFFARPDLTSGILLNQAQFMTEHQRYRRAQMYYNWAWALEPARTDIPILLSETYVLDNNYTKAEYTLIKAITDNPSHTELYTALSRTYVLQNKLLDAVQMLDRTTDAKVKADLDLLRPAAPVVSPDSGFYSEYIQVSATADTDIIYLTGDGEYPSSDQDLYTEPLALEAGETTIMALSVNEAGLVSPLVLNGYTVAGVIEEVTFCDPAVELAVREQLSLGPNEPIMSDLLWSITHLSLSNSVKDLTDLAYFTGLQSLSVQNVSGLDMTPLQFVPALQRLDLSGCTISSNAMDTIGALLELEVLNLNRCALTDISSFAQLSKLTVLQLADNTLNDISVLSLMPNLQVIDLTNNPLTSIAALSACDQLTSVNITGCSVTTLGSLSGKKALTAIYASGNQLKSIDELAECQSLSILEVSDNFIDDIQVLALLPSLTRFEGDQNLIREIPQFNETTCVLAYFGVDYNQIEDISGLAGVDTLNYLNADYNKIKDLSPLENNHNLVQVNVWDNAVTEESVAALQEHAIIVNFNPNYEDPDADEDTEADN